MVMKGQYGLPEHYPSPPISKDILFYIQRNQNLNTVVYELNRLHDGRINEEYPMHIYWIRYSEKQRDPGAKLYSEQIGLWLYFK